MEELKNIKVALLGSGTVGTGVYKLIERQREELPHKVGAGWRSVPSQCLK